MATIADFLIHHMVTALMLAIGLRTSASAIAGTWRERAFVARTLLVILIGVPLLSLAVVKLLPLNAIATGLILIMAVCPGAPLVLQEFRHRRVAVAIIAIVAVFAPATVAAWIEVLHGLRFGVVPDSRALVDLTVQQLVPLGIGILVATRWPRVAAPCARVAWFVFLAGFALVAVALLYRGVPGLMALGPMWLVALALIAAGSIAMAHWAAPGNADDRALVAKMALLGNPAIALMLIASIFPGFKPGPLFLANVLVRVLAYFGYSGWSRYRAKHTSHHPDAGLRGGVAAT